MTDPRDLPRSTMPCPAGVPEDQAKGPGNLAGMPGGDWATPWTPAANPRQKEAEQIIRTNAREAGRDETLSGKKMAKMD